MKKETFGFRIIKSLFSVFSGIVTLIGIAISFIAWKFNPNTKISLFVFMIVCSGFILILAIFIRLSVQLFEEKSENSAKVIRSVAPYAPYKNSETILLVTNMNAFAINGLVSVFIEKKECEIFIATGEIINIQQNGNIQVLIPKSKNSDFDWDKLKSNDKDVIEKLIVKPIVTTRLLGGE